jgi:hypothetical protein
LTLLLDAVLVACGALPLRSGQAFSARVECPRIVYQCSRALGRNALRLPESAESPYQHAKSLYQRAVALIGSPDKLRQYARAIYRLAVAVKWHGRARDQDARFVDQCSDYAERSSNRADRLPISDALAPDHLDRRSNCLDR